MRLYTASQAEQAVGCTYRQIDHWVSEGVITPSLDAHGSGRFRGFSEFDVVVLRAVHVLRERGMSLSQCATFVDRIRRAPKAKEIRVREGVVLVSLDLDKVRNEVTRALRSFDPALEPVS